MKEYQCRMMSIFAPVLVMVMKKCFNVLLTASLVAMGLVISSYGKDNATTPDAPQ